MTTAKRIGRIDVWPDYTTAKAADTEESKYTGRLTVWPTYGLAQDNIEYPAEEDGGGIDMAVLHLSSSDFLNLHVTPKTIIAAQGPDTLILPLWLTVKYNFGTTPYAIGGDQWDPELRFNGVGTIKVDPIDGGASLIFLDGADASKLFLSRLVDFGNTDAADCINKAFIVAQDPDSPFISGDGSADLTVWYQVLEGIV